MAHSFKTMMMTTLFALALAGTSQAGYTVNVTESGGDVVAVGSGTIDTTDLTYVNTYGGGTSKLVSDTGTALFGPTYFNAAALFVYAGISGPSSFGPGPMPGAYVDATSGTGDFVGIPGAGSSFPTSIFVPENYVSGTFLSASDTWAGQTFATLGLTPGTYTWTWGSGADADFFTMNIGASSAVPEPSSLALCGIAGVAGAGMAWKRRMRVG